MVLTIARMPYLHAEPYYIDMERRGFTLVDLVPSAMAHAAEQGDIDAGLFSLVDSFRLETSFEPVANFGIACLREAGSLFLYAKKPIEELGGAPIGMTDEASTAPCLLEILLRFKYKVPPATYVSRDEPHDGFVLIGNQALRQRRGARGYPHTYDLGEEWHTWTQMPLVFSRWMVRKTVDPKVKAILQDTLYVGLEEGVNAMYQIQEPRDRLLMLPRDITQYIQGLRFYLRLPEEQSMHQFRQYLQQIKA
jgi:chorismate dehydratase